MKRKLLSLILMLALIIALIPPVRAEATMADFSYYWSRQPENVQNYLIREGVQFHIVDQLPPSSCISTTGYTLAYTNTYTNGDIITGVEVYCLKGFEQYITHEIGHVLSHYNKHAFLWASTPEFLQIWETEKDGSYICNTTMTEQGLTSPIEYFAVSYDAYINYGDLMKQKCPRTYKYIDTVVKNTI